jgi:hypothetical protein
MASIVLSDRRTSARMTTRSRRADGEDKRNLYVVALE